MSRAAIAIAVALAVLAGGSAWLRPESAGQSHSIPSFAAETRWPLRVGVPYCVDASSESIEFSLPAEPEARYLLIVGSLGNPHRVHRVELRAVRADSPPGINAVPLRPWGTRRASRAKRVNRCVPPARGPDGPSGPAQSTFHLHVTDGPLDDARQYVGIAAREIARGERVTVLLDSAEPLNDRLNQTAREIVRLYETQVLPRTRQLLGTHVDVNGDGRLTILLTPWLGRLEGGRTSLGGLVRPADFRLDVPAPFSNRCDLLFLNSNVAPGPRLHALLAHEYAHVVTFSHRGAASAAMEDDWLSEGLAHVCEHLHHAGWTNLDHRIARFLQAPRNFPLVIANYHQSGLWRSRGCRGAAFLFLRWCVDQFGEPFLRQLTDADAVGVPNIERTSGYPFDGLFRRWCLAIYCAGADDNVRGAIGPAIPRFRSLALRGRVGKHLLEGPKTELWRATDCRKAIELRGTAAAFIEIRPGSAEGRRFTIQATPGARPQVTLLRLPDTTIRRTAFQAVRTDGKSVLRNSAQAARNHAHCLLHPRLP
jgi:hypothetical protein